MLFLVFLSPVDTKMFLIKAFVTNGDFVDRYLMGVATTSWKHLQIKKIYIDVYWRLLWKNFDRKI